MESSRTVKIQLGSMAAESSGKFNPPARLNMSLVVVVVVLGWWWVVVVVVVVVE